MSVVLNNAVIISLRKAYEAYMEINSLEFKYHLQVAEQAIEAIRKLKDEQERDGRVLELLYLDGELALISGFAYIDRPKMLLERYKLAETLLITPPSRVIDRDSAFFPPSICLQSVLRSAVADGAAAERDFSEAIAIYDRLIGGGAGIDSLYKAVRCIDSGELSAARDKLREASIIGGAWMKPHIKMLLSKTEGGEEK